MEKKKNRGIIVGITSLLLVTLILVGLTYAYYRTRVIGNQSTDPSISVQSKKLEIVYNDGSGKIKASGIEPNYTATKTFSVENTGDEPITYAVYLQDVVNTFVTEDFVYELICSPECNGTTEFKPFPKLNEKLVENTILSGEKQEYTFNVNYPETNKNQSDDMGQTISGFIQIYTIDDRFDIVGSIADAKDGDFVQINSEPKTSVIYNGMYKLVGVEAGNHTLSVRDKNGNVKGSTTLQVNLGTENIDGSTITIDKLTEEVTVNISSLTENLGITVLPEMENYNPYNEGTLAHALFEDENIIKNSNMPLFTGAATENEGLYSALDDYGTSWYFRGAQENNYVSFAGFIWRIVRINGDGSVRLILQKSLENAYRQNNDGTYEETAAGTKIAWSAKRGSNANIGYMFGDNTSELYSETHKNTSSSKIKNTVDTFYENYIENAEKNYHYEQYLADTLFCEDKTLASQNIGANNTALGTLKNITYYAATERVWFSDGKTMITKATPTLKCAVGAEDNYSRYTSSLDSSTTTSLGVEVNNDLKHPIALLSVDELVMAGAFVQQYNKEYYLYDSSLTSELNSFWWVMTPYFHDGANAIMFNSNPPGSSVGNYKIYNTGARVRPVINLRSDLIVAGGNGTISSPYTLKIN